MLVDMAGSENIEQAGQIGLEAKMQASSLIPGFLMSVLQQFQFSFVTMPIDIVILFMPFQKRSDGKDQSGEHSFEACR